jgi:hypothetical protein
MMFAVRSSSLLFWVLALGAVPTSLSETRLAVPSDPRDLDRSRQLTITKSKADLDGDRQPEAIMLVNAITGERDLARAYEVVVAIAELDRGTKRGALKWARHIMRDTGQPAHHGELTAVDLDGDGVSELIVTWDRGQTEKGTDRWCEIYSARDLIAPRKIWEGVWEQDRRQDPTATEKTWIRREIDFGKTRREAGRALIFSVKTVAAGANSSPTGEPRVERVEVSLRSH